MCRNLQCSLHGPAPRTWLGLFPRDLRWGSLSQPGCWRRPQSPPRLFSQHLLQTGAKTPLLNGREMLVLTTGPSLRAVPVFSAILARFPGLMGVQPGVQEGCWAGAERVLSSPVQQNSAIRAGAARRVSAIAPFQPNSWRATVLPAPRPFKPSIKSVINSENTLHPNPAAAKASSQQVLTRPFPIPLRC